MATEKDKTKGVKLRAFKIENNDINRRDSGLLPLLSGKLNSSIVKDRRMRLNQDDPKKEEDLICDYDTSRPEFVSGAVLRIMASSDIPNIPDSLFDEPKIVIKDLDSLGVDESSIYKDHYYFLLNNNILIVGLFSATITRFQTYINWLTASDRGDMLYEFTPLTKGYDSIRIDELRSIRVQDPNTTPRDNGDGELGSKKIANLSKDYLSSLFKDVRDLGDIQLDKIVSAELFIKFKKPKEMSKDEYQRVLGAYMKPISDTDNVAFIPKKGRPIRGSEILREKTVNIEVVSSGKLSEPQLLQEMERFLSEIRNEEVS